MSRDEAKGKTKIQIEDYRAFFGGILLTTVHGLTGQWNDAAGSATEVMKSVGLDQSEEKALSQLFFRSLWAAVHAVVKENMRFLQYIPGADGANATALDMVVAEKKKQFMAGFSELPQLQNVEIDTQFFVQPLKSEAFLTAQTVFRQWLRATKATERQADTIANQLPGHFAFALNDEWKRNLSRYQRLEQQIDTPFLRYTLEQQEWSRYRAYLQQQISVPILDDVFSLEQIYIPLNAYYIIQSDKGGEKLDCEGEITQKKQVRRVVNLKTTLDQWIASSTKDDAVRVIRGGPGSGKSSFAKIFAADLAARAYDVLYIPLHRLNIEQDFQDTLTRYLRDSDFFSQSYYLDADRLIVILDGLDELTQQGYACIDAAQRFVNNILQYVQTRNMTKLRLQLILTGRDLVVQHTESLFRKERQILHLVDYFVPDDEDDSSHDCDHFLFDDPMHLLTEDKRNHWWKRYGELTGKDYHEGMPKELHIDRLDTLTVQPLLNYLVALSYQRGKIVFSQDTNLNDVYRDLLDAVYERGYEGSVHRGLRFMLKEDYERILEEIAVSAWHNAGRVTTVKEIEAHCQRSNIQHLLAPFQETAKAGLTDLLTAFYFRQAGVQGGESTFEFTHKSFSEYLVAMRILRMLESIQRDLQLFESTRHEQGRDETECLRRWIELCSETPLDGDIYRFLCDGAASLGKETAQRLQTTVTTLISHMLQRGMPFENIAPRPTYLQETKLSRNAEEALLACHSACAYVTQTVGSIQWPSEDAAGAWINRLRGQRVVGEDCMPLECLHHLDFSRCIFDMIDLFKANMEASRFIYASFSSAVIDFSNMVNTDLRGTNFPNALLQGVNLQGANLKEAVFISADLRGADFQGADLSGSYLCGANMASVFLLGARLLNADFRGANLQISKSFGNRSGIYVSMNERDNVDSILIYLYSQGAILDDQQLARLRELGEAVDDHPDE